MRPIKFRSNPYSARVPVTTHIFLLIVTITPISSQEYRNHHWQRLLRADIAAQLGARRIEELSAVQRRRRYSADQKLAVLQEAAQPGTTVFYVARYGIALSLIFNWRKRMSGRR
jgi:siroheme synthase